MSGLEISREHLLKSAAALSVATAIPWLPARAASPLITRAIPKTGEQIPMIGLGTASSYAGTQDLAARRDVIKTLLDGGATLIDTAPSYANTEETTGEILEELKARPKAFVATKLRIEGRDAGIASMTESFRKLKVDKIDLMQVHNLVDTETHLATLKEWKAAGRFRYIGITHWQPEAQEQLAPVMAKHDIDFIQLNYSLDVRDAEKTLLPLAQQRGIGVLVNVPLGRGQLLERVKGKPLPGIAKDLGCESFAQLLLKFVLAHPAVTAAIPATSKAKNMADNLGAARGRLPDAKERQAIVEFWDKA